MRAAKYAAWPPFSKVQGSPFARMFQLLITLVSRKYNPASLGALIWPSGSVTSTV